MGWKNWSSWLKGGVILLILDLIFIVFAYITSSNGEGISLALMIVQVPFTSLLILFKGSLYASNINSLVILFGGLITWFIIGALIGGIVGKVKSKKTEKLS